MTFIMKFMTFVISSKGNDELKHMLIHRCQECLSLRIISADKSLDKSIILSGQQIVSHTYRIVHNF